MRELQGKRGPQGRARFQAGEEGEGRRISLVMGQWVSEGRVGKSQSLDDSENEQKRGCRGFYCD